MRNRATVLIIRDGKVLLVLDKGKDDYSMPGGGFKKVGRSKESTIQAGIREATEELKLKTISATRLRFCDHDGKRANHKVCLLVVEGEPHIDPKELDGFIWWDMKQKIKLQGHVEHILKEYKSKGWQRLTIPIPLALSWVIRLPIDQGFLWNSFEG